MNAVERKAGIVPYFVNSVGEVEMLFMISSDPKFGGGKPMPSKGGIEVGEQPQDAALREGYEELGLLSSNIVDIEPIHAERYGYKNVLTGVYTDAHVAYYCGRVLDKVAFDPVGYETSRTVWLTAEQYSVEGRRVDRQLVDKVDHHVKAKLVRHPHADIS